MSEVRVRMALRGIRMEYCGSRAFFDRHIAPLLEGAQRRAEAAALHAPADPLDAQPAFKPSSARHFQEFATKVGARAGTVDQRIMAFAFYLWNFEKKDEFQSGDIDAFFRTVREMPPEDLGDRLGVLANTKRFLEPGRAPEAWVLAPKGLNYVKNRLLSAV